MANYEHRNAVFTQRGDIDCEINHPGFGWIPTTLSPDDDADFFNAVKAGTVAPYVAPPPPPPPTDDERFLTPVQFAYLLALTGFDDVWAALEAGAKSTNIEQYALLKAERARPRFQLSKTLEIVDSFRPAAAVIAPDTDLSEAAIRAAWEQAEGYGSGRNE